MASSWREGEFGKRPVRIANCSGYCGDPSIEMYKQATLGQVDFITGDYLAEINLAANATAYLSGHHPGYEPSALNGLAAALDALATNRIKVAINGGALNPRGLAQRVAALAHEKGHHDLRVAYVDGDDLREQIGRSNMPSTEEEAVGWLPHLDAASAGEGGKEEAFAFLRGGDGEGVAEGENAGGGGQPIVSANAYLGARGIATALRNGADIVIAGRVADASPVVAAAWYWWGWDDGAYDALAGALVAGHLIECSAVRVSGIKGLPPPPTTKLAVFYKGGYECQILVNATGYGWREKCELFEKQVRRQLGEDLIRKLDILEFQRIGVPAENPWDQNSSTMYIRIVAQSRSEAALKKLAPAVNSISLRHFHGYHCSLDWRTASPKPYLAFYPALWPQSRLAETAHFVSPTTGETTSSHPAGHPPTYAPLGPRDTYDTASPIPSPSTSAATQRIRLGDIALARSGDKGGNLNVGIFLRHSSNDSEQEQKQWDWLRSYLSRKRMWELLGGDAAKGVYRIERVEFARIKAVHFVVYGLLGRGVSSATRLDAFGKGFADYFRDKVVEVPVEVLGMGVGVGEKARM
ncbi:hypothetical protein DBV05_g6125 [Lasiodiplodia theobromae]|uniref:DUF1446 domain-containing protein n=1 Tax=Lasiodiplodia theobromae TaxID=45133 RepID=A0A5N5DBZ0_9PEZI|nr:hypothetical protein DBV05_g6125 [Lasiodiplodia theobromae]